MWASMVTIAPRELGQGDDAGRRSRSASGRVCAAMFERMISPRQAHALVVICLVAAHSRDDSRAVRKVSIARVHAIAETSLEELEGNEAAHQMAKYDNGH